MLKNILLIVLLATTINLSFSQKIDSLLNELETAKQSEKINIYKQISDYYLNYDPKLARYYTRNALELAKSMGQYDVFYSLYSDLAESFSQEKKFDSALHYLDSAENYLSDSKKKTKAFFYLKKGILLYSISQFEQSEEYINKSLSVYEELQDTISQIMCIEALGTIYYMKSNYAKAIEYFMKELHLAEATNHLEAQAASKNNIAMTYSKDGDNPNALKYYNEAEKLYKKINNTRGLVTVYNNIGNIYTLADSLNIALDYFKKAALLADQMKDEILLATCRTNIAEIYITQEKYNQAQTILDDVIPVFEKYNLYSNLSAAYLLRGKLLFNKKNFFEAEKEYQRGLYFALKSGNKDLEKDIYSEMKNLYYAWGKYKNAYIYSDKYTKLKDSLYNIENSLKINQLKLNYETEKKDKEIQLSKLKIDRQKRLLIFFEIAFTIIIILITIASIFYRKLNRSYQLLVEKNIALVEEKQKNNNIEQKDNIKEKDTIKDIGLKKEQIDELRKGIEKLIQEKFYLDRDINLDKMSKMLNTNKLYLSKFINYEYGKNFNWFINDFRVEEAQKLLISKEYEIYTLDAIAQKVGFNSRSSFYSVFKKITGVTPYFYRKQMNSTK